MTYEELENEAYSQNIDIIEKPMQHKNLKGLYADDTILIDSNMNEEEKNCVLAEEIGHYYTTYGDILNLTICANRKKENLARKWAINRLVPIDKLKQFATTDTTLEELAENFNVTAAFIVESVQYYKCKNQI